MDQLSAFGAEDIVDMPTDALHVFCMCCVLSRTVRMAGLMAYTLTEERVCIPILCVVALVFPLASGAASCLLCASYAFYVVCTFDSVAASGFAFPCFSCFARFTCCAGKLGGVAAAIWVSV